MVILTLTIQVRETLHPEHASVSITRSNIDITTGELNNSLKTTRLNWREFEPIQEHCSPCTLRIIGTLTKWRTVVPKWYANFRHGYRVSQCATDFLRLQIKMFRQKTKDFILSSYWLTDLIFTACKQDKKAKEMKKRQNLALGQSEYGGIEPVGLFSWDNNCLVILSSTLS